MQKGFAKDEFAKDHFSKDEFVKNKDAWMDALKKALTDHKVTTNDTEREHHSHDESYHTAHLPDVVVYPEANEDVQAVMRIASRYGVPVVPYGVGTSLEGHPIPIYGGISLDLTRMNRILDIRPDDFLVHVQAGLTREALNKALRPHGLMFTVDPGADATLGGMAATNASGTTAVRYGVMRDHVRGMTVVLYDGTLLRLGGSYVKSSSGYNLKHLFIGSEGTLGVITELTLSLVGIPEMMIAARLTFPSVQQAVHTAHQMLRLVSSLARVELVDRTSIEQMNQMKGTDYPPFDTLFLELHGNRAGLVEDESILREVAHEGGATHIQFETNQEAREKLWEARHHLAYAYLHAHPGKKQLVTDVCVPLTVLPEAIEVARQTLKEEGLDGGVLGHIGDGNFHTIVMVDDRDPEDIARAERLHERLVHFALQHGGTSTGEHGVGLGKLPYQREEHGAALDWMVAIKRLFDPQYVLNPGKKIPFNP